MSAPYVSGYDWPVRCGGSLGGVRVWESFETDPQAPPWRVATEWCLRPRRERIRHGVRRITTGEILKVCPELAGRLF